MRDLEQVPWLPVSRDRFEDVVVVVVLEVTRQQHTLPAQADREHDRGAVDGTTIREHTIRDGLSRWPEDVDTGAAER